MSRTLEYLNPGSMTFWTGLTMIGYGSYQCAIGNADEGVRSIMEGFGLIFLKRAILSGPQ